MDQPARLLVGRDAAFRIYLEDSEDFIGQVTGGFGRRVVDETAGVAQPLRFSQIRFAAAQSVLRPFDVLNVGLRYIPTIDLTTAVTMGIGSK